MKFPLPTAIIFLIAIAGLGGFARTRGRKSRAIPNLPALEGCSRIYEFKDARGSVVGVLYGQLQTPDSYSRLVVVDEAREPPEVLYELEAPEIGIKELRDDSIVVTGGLIVQWYEDTRRFLPVRPR